LPPPVTVNVWPLPNVTLSNTTSVFCSSSSFTTTVPYNSGYSYQWYDGGGPLSGKTAFSFNTNSAGTYRVVVIDVASGCSATSVPLTLTSLPSPSAPAIAGPASFCQRSSVTLTASSTGGTGALTYSWLSGQTTTSITVSSAGFYQVQVTDQNGCSRSAGKSVTVNPLPDFSIFPAGCYTKCGKDSIFGPAGYATYQWQLNGANISTAQNIKSTISGTYKLIISTSLGCIDTSGDLNLTIAPLPVANAGPDIILCGGTAQLNGTGGGIYTWSPPTFLSSTTIPNPTTTPTSTIDYELLVTDKNGCKDIDSVKVTVNPSFTVSTNQTNIICSGGTGSASTSVGSGTSPYTYTWNNGQTTATATGLTAGDYTVTVTDAKGCTSTTNSSIISPPPLTGQFTKGTANCTNCGCKEWLMVTGTGGTSPYTYSWPDGYVNRYKNQLCPGSYTINVKDKNGCSTNLIVNAP
ncbi:MAG: hypothetical protein JNL63_04240, partial [Bacteroidia bacterium]|nr:hypothetical protein [Bacteroidia bacterium]